MQQIIQCPRCAQRYQAAPEWAGHVTNCPACGTPIQVPGPQPYSPPQLTPFAVSPLDPFASQPPVKPQPAYPQPPSGYAPSQPAYLQEPPIGSPGTGMHPMVWVAIGGGVIAVFFVFTLVLLF